MFDFLSMAGNYQQRKVDNTVINNATIDTVAVTDSKRPYETGIRHPEYRNGNWIIVEMYDSKKEAKIGHARWVKVFSDKKLPDQLTDINECSLEDIANSVGHTTRGVFKRAKK